MAFKGDDPRYDPGVNRITGRTGPLRSKPYPVMNTTRPQQSIPLGMLAGPGAAVNPWGGYGQQVASPYAGGTSFLGPVMGQRRIGGYGNTGGGSTGSGGASGQQSAALSELYQKKYDEARAANQKRYDDILAGYDKLTGDAKARADQQLAAAQQANTMLQMQYQARQDQGLDMLKGLGDQQYKDINRDFDSAGARTQQSVVDRGLYGSTIQDNLQAGNERDRQEALARAKENIQRQNLNVFTDLSGDTLGYGERGQGRMDAMSNANLGRELALGQDRLGFMERRTDSYPDQAQFIGLQDKLGQGGYGSYGGGGAPSPQIGSSGGIMRRDSLGRMVEQFAPADPAPSQYQVNSRNQMTSAAGASRAALQAATRKRLGYT